MKLSKRARFPLGHDITLDELDRDPYPVFARLREREPISWLPALNMWYVVGYEDVRTALFDSTRLTTASPHSTIFDTFGAQVLTTEGATHDRYRQADETAVRAQFHSLASGVGDTHGRGRAGRGIRNARPSRPASGVCQPPADSSDAVGVRPCLPMPSRKCAAGTTVSKPRLRILPGIMAYAQPHAQSVAEFHALLDSAIGSIKESDEHSLLARLVSAPAGERLEQ